MAKVLDNIKEAIGHKLLPRFTEHFQQRLEEEQNKSIMLEEAYNRLELEIENEGYYRLTQLADSGFGRERLTSIIKMASMMAIKNPITNRSVTVQGDYVFGQGVRFVAKSLVVQGLIDEFIKYPGNRRVLTSNIAMKQRERDLQVEGNLFLALFVNERTGRVNVRYFPMTDVVDVIRDPNDYSRELFIKRSYDNENHVRIVTYYPALGITESMVTKAPWEYTDDKEKGNIEWSVPVLHVAFNRFGKEKFAIPEIYPQLDWALAYKRFLEDWTSIIRSFARMAMKLTGLKGSKQAAAAKSKLNTTVNLSNISEKNPSAVGGSTALLGQGVDVEAVKTAGATTPASEGGPILNMAAAGVGLPNTFFGDASIGNYATSKTLDRPTELKMISRQELWKEVFTYILEFAIQQAAICPDGLLAQAGVVANRVSDVFSNDDVYVLEPPEDMDLSFEVVFPPILERNVTDRVRALVNAVTMFGKQLTDIIPDKSFVARLLMEALGIPDIEARLPGFLEMWKKNMVVEDGKPADPNIIPPPSQAAPGGFGAEDPSQGGDVGANG